MIYLIIPLLLSLAFPAVADPSLSATAGRDVDSKQSDTIKRDKSLSADKSHGNRKTWSSSEEQSRELSKTRSDSARESTNEESSHTSSTDININSLLLQSFINRYEAEPPSPDDAKPRIVFFSCKPLTGTVSEYPTLNSCPQQWGMHQALDMDAVVPRRLASKFSDNACGSMSGKNGRDRYNKLWTPDPNNPVVGQYARCRILASRWITEAARRAIQQEVASEQDVREHIEQAFIELENNPALFEQFIADAQQVWSHANCAPLLSLYSDFTGVAFNCGVVRIKDDSIVIEGRQTLSESAIEGRSFKIGLNAQQSHNASLEASTSADARTSVSARDSITQDKFKEAKNTASLSKSRSQDLSTSESMRRGSGSDMRAAPQQ